MASFFCQSAQNREKGPLPRQTENLAHRAPSILISPFWNRTTALLVAEFAASTTLSGARIGPTYLIALYYVGEHKPIALSIVE